MAITEIIHISDLHIDIDKRAKDVSHENNNLVKIVDAIKGRYGEPDSDGNPYIIITGDVSDNGNAEEFIVARRILGGLYENKFNIMVIPGNHDYGLKGNLLTHENMIYFDYVFNDGKAVEYPVVDNINGHLFVGLNSTLGVAYGDTGDELVFADGMLGKEQVDRAVAEIGGFAKGAGKKVVVYLHHHPFILPDMDRGVKWTFEKLFHCLRDKDFMEKIKGKVDILMFGHDHEHLYFRDTELNSAYGIEHIVCSGKSTALITEPHLDNDGHTRTVTRELDVMGGKAKYVVKAPEELNSGLMGRRITIDDGGNVDVVTVKFNGGVMT